MIKWNLSKQHTKILVLAMGFWILGDLFTTWAFLSIGHTEQNPLFFWLSIETFWIMIPIKIGFGLIGTLIINYYAKWNDCICLVHKKIKAIHLITFFFLIGFSVSIANLIGVIFNL